MDVDGQILSAHLDTDARTSCMNLPARAEETSADLLRSNTNKMTTIDHEEMEITLLKGNGTKTGQTIRTTISDQNGKLKQICQALCHVHRVVGVWHHDIKPQNALVNPHTHQVPGEPNVSYIWIYRIYHSNSMVCW